MIYCTNYLLAEMKCWTAQQSIAVGRGQTSRIKVSNENPCPSLDDQYTMEATLSVSCSQTMRTVPFCLSELELLNKRSTV